VIPERYSEATVPTEYGPVRVVVYREEGDKEHMALIVGDIDRAREPLLVRVHSECWTGEVLRSHKCDCRDQLDRAMRAMQAAGAGVVVYMRQEGRGIGLGNKIKAYALQEKGADTVDANRLLGFEDDARTYDVAAAMLRDLDVDRITLLTNNPKKVDGLRAHGITVSGRESISVTPNAHNADYLAVKAKKMGHAL
jgi:GTP cyclohydrolase II/3,4-dihydroxy 2-butanone 4-phosphate synthase/GTP cyclohydrolase II